MYKFLFSTEDAVKGDKESNVAHRERDNVAAWNLSYNCSATSKAGCKKPLNDDSPVMPWLVEHAGCILSRCQKGRDRKTPFERLHCEKPTQEFGPFGEEALARKIATDLMYRANPRCPNGI